MKYLVIAIFFLTLFSCKKEDVQPEFMVIARKDMRVYTEHCGFFEVPRGKSFLVQAGKQYSIGGDGCNRTVIFDPRRLSIDPCTY